MHLHRASWHSSATLTEVCPCFFLSCKANARVEPARTGYGPHSSKIFLLLYVLFVLCRSLYCLCINVYCTAATGCQPNCSLTNIYIIFSDSFHCLTDFRFVLVSNSLPSVRDLCANRITDYHKGKAIDLCWKSRFKFMLDIHWTKALYPFVNSMVILDPAISYLYDPQPQQLHLM